MDRGACQAIVRGVKKIRHDSNSTTTTTVRASSTFKPVNFNLASLVQTYCYRIPFFKHITCTYVAEPLP